MRLMCLSDPSGEVAYVNPEAIAVIRPASGEHRQTATELQLLDGSRLWVRQNAGEVARYWEREQDRHMTGARPIEELEGEP
jgi:hypothetical protein